MMEGNIVEALREKKIAETMMGSNNYKLARDKLLNAQLLFPGLGNISAMLTVCDILCAANVGFPGCWTDWYWVLQLKPTANESLIKSQYHKLTTLLEPIKNEFPGTDSALKLIQKAFSVLSDREKRAEFDSKRSGSRGGYGSVYLQGKSDLEIENTKKEATSRRSSIKFAFGTADEALNKIRIVDEQRKKMGAQEAGLTGSKRGAERPLESKESSVRSGGSYGNPSKPFCKKPDPDFYNFDNNRKAEVFAVGQVWAAYDQERMPRRYGRISRICMLPFQLCLTWLKPTPIGADEKRWCEVGLPYACGSFYLDMGTTVVAEPSLFSHVVSRVASVTNEPVEIYPQKGEVWAIYRDWKPFDWCSNPETRKGYRLQMVEILTGYSKQTGLRVVHLMKVDGFNCIFQRHTDEGSVSSFQIPATHSCMFSHNVPAFRFVGGEMDRVSAGMLELDPLAVPADLVRVMARSSEDGSSSDCSSFTDYPPNLPSMVSEPVGESLKPSWSAKDFGSDQTWAVYDGPDLMPQRYAIVNNVVSGSEVCVTLLEPHPILNEEMYWVNENLPFVCGLFMVGRTTLNLGMSRFSHLMKCERSTNKSLYRIYPRKGEVWAVYRNWNSKWKQSDYNGHQCRVVEVLSDFSEEIEMRIASLVQVRGFLTFFQRKLEDGFELMRAVSKTEMLSFSHQIPAFTVPGIESHGIPKGSWHLEPDALPPKLSN